MVTTSCSNSATSGAPSATPAANETTYSSQRKSSASSSPDPTNFLGWGFFGKIPKLGKTLPFRALDNVDQAYIKASQAVTDGIIKGFFNGAKLPGFNLNIPGVRGIPGLQKIFRLNVRTVANRRSQEFMAAVRATDEVAWRNDTPGGFKDLLRKIRENPDGGTAEGAHIASVLDDLQAFEMGQLVQRFGPSGELIAPLRAAEGETVRKPQAYVWQAIDDVINKESTQKAVEYIQGSIRQMVHNSKSAEIIRRRNFDRRLVHRLVDDGTDYITARFQFGVGAKANRLAAETMLAFGMYPPGNIIEDAGRSIGGGVIPGMDNNYTFQMWFGDTAHAMPNSVWTGGGSQAAEFGGKDAAEGYVDRLLGDNVFGKTWYHTAGRFLRTSKDWSIRLRRYYLRKKTMQELEKDLVPLLMKSEDTKHVLKDLIVGGAMPMTFLDEKTRDMMQKLAMNFLGSDPELLRQMSQEVVTHGLPDGMLDILAGQSLQDTPPIVRRKLLNRLRTGGLRHDRITDAIEAASDDIYKDMVTTEPELMLDGFEQYLNYINSLAESNPKAIGDLIGRTSVMLHQLENMGLVMHRALVDHELARQKPGKGLTRSLAHLWPTVDEKLLKLHTLFDESGIKARLADKLRQTARGLDDPDVLTDVEAVIKGFDDRFDEIVHTREEVSRLRDQYFDEKGLSEQAIAEAGGYSQAYDKFHREKSLLYDEQVNKGRGPYIQAAQTAARLSGDSRFGRNAAEFIASELEGGGTWMKGLEAVAEGMRFNDLGAAKVRSLKQFESGLRKQLADGALNDGNQEIVQKYFDNIAGAMEGISPDIRSEIKAVREGAIGRSLESYNREFTNYDDTMAIDDVMSAFAPFWRYQSRAWPSLIKFGVHRPGFAEMFRPEGYYWELTDDGYVPMDIFDLQVSPIRGLILGRTRRAYANEYPPEHSGALGEIEKVQNRAERFGFFLGPWQGWLAKSGATTVSGRSPTADLGEDLPPVLETLVNGIVYGSTKTDQTIASTFDAIGGPGTYEDLRFYDPNIFVDMVNTVFPNRFKDYYVNTYLVSKFQKTRREISADPELAWMLREAEQGVAWRQMISAQGSLTRFRPDGFEEMKKTLDEKSSEISGLSVEEIQEYRKDGKRIQDVVELSRVDLAELRTLRQFELLGSVYEPLDTTEKARVQNLARGYYENTDRVRDAAREEQSQDDAMLSAGLMLGSRWRKEYSNRWTRVNGFTQMLKDSPHYRGAPLTAEARQAFNERFSIETPLRSPVDSILDQYYSIEPLKDPRTQETDWTTFFRQREETLDLLPDEERAEVVDYIRGKETPVMKEFRDGRTFMPMYWDTDTYVPLWYEALGYPGRATQFRRWSKAYSDATYDHQLALQNGVHPQIAKRIISRPEFKLVETSTREYRRMLRNPATISRVPFADSRIPGFLQKFYSQ